VNQNTSAFRSRGWVEHLIANLPRLLGSTGMHVGGLDGVPAFIVGAGSSLDLNHHLLPECQKRGIVIAVNAAARLPGVDVALSVESNDLRFKLGPLQHVAIRVFSMISHPAVMAHGAGELLPIYAGELGSLMEPLVGAPKLACSAHGGTAAMSLAERWGCGPIVLLGHDFAVGERSYPKCLGLGENPVRIEGDAVRFSWSKELREQPRANPLHEADARVDVPALGGGVISSTMALAGTRRWFESAAIGLGEQTRLINASEWGASLEGWEAKTLESVLAELPEASYQMLGATGLSEERLLAWTRQNIAGCHAVSRACETVLTDVDGGLRELLAALRGAPLAEAWCLAPTLEIMAARRAAPMHENQRTEWQAAGTTARELAAMTIGELPELVSKLEEACSSIIRCRQEPSATLRVA
jgi:hypothetical protein